MLIGIDRESVVARLDRDHIENLAEQAKSKLWSGQAVELEYVPGNATWYALILAPVNHLIGAPGGGNTKSFLGWSPKSFLGECTHVVVYAQRERAAWFDPELHDMDWVAAKLTDNEHDVVAIGELLQAVFA
jgi:hypothetical protein